VRLARAADLPSHPTVCRIGGEPCHQASNGRKGCGGRRSRGRGLRFVSEVAGRRFMLAPRRICSVRQVPRLPERGHASRRPRLGHGSGGQGRASATWAADCHHVLLQSGRKSRVHRFYEHQPFRPRTAYVVREPGRSAVNSLRSGRLVALAVVGGLDMKGESLQIRY
jgi:hypothetical protein